MVGAIKSPADLFCRFRTRLLGSMTTRTDVFRYLATISLLTLGVCFAIEGYYYAGIASAIAGMYAWFTFGNVVRDGRAIPLIRTFGPSLVILTVVLAASAGLARNLPRVDFGMFYSSALLLRQDPSHLYDSQRQTEFLHSVTGLAGESFYLPFAYPPVVAFLLIPLSALSFRSAYYVMFGVNVLLLAFSLWWLSRALAFRTDQITAFLVLASAALPMYAVFVLGHLTFIGLLLLSLFATDCMSGKFRRAGLWAGLMLYKPTLFPIPLLLLLWKKQWKALAMFSGVAAGLFAFSFALVGWEGLRANVIMLRLMTSDYFLPKTQSLRSLVYFFGLGQGFWIALVLIVLAALWVAVLYAPNQRWVMVCAAIALLLTPPYLQFYDLSMGLVGAAVAISAMESVSDRSRNVLFLIVLLSSALALAGPKNQPSLPVMPIVLALFFCYGLRKAFAPGLKPSTRTEPA